MGADHRVFSRLGVAGYEFVPLPWVAYDEQDTLVTYAQKIATNIKEDQPILLGLSFGGMLATEISKQLPVKQTILVSSAKTKTELPEPGRLGRYIVKQKLIPSFCFAIPNKVIMALRGTVPLWDKINTGGTNASNGAFMQWALKVIMDWPGGPVPANLTHIHGTADIIIPAKNVHADHWVKGGGHVMVFSRAKEVSEIIAGILNKA